MSSHGCWTALGVVGRGACSFLALAALFAGSAFAQPANDECVGAIAVFNGTTAGLSNVGATENPADPAWPAACATAGADVWFTYAATCTGTGSFSTCFGPAPLMDSVMEVFGGVCGALGAPLGCADDTCGGFGTGQTVSVPVTAGSTYIIRIGGWGLPPVYPYATGSFDLTISCTATPPTSAADECAAATPVVGGLNGPFTNASATTGAPVVITCTGSPTGFYDVWFQYTASCTGPVELTTCDQTGLSAPLMNDTLVTVYTACGGTSIACNDDASCGPIGFLSRLNFNATAGVTYLIRVANYDNLTTTGGAFNLTVTCNPSSTRDYGDAPGAATSNLAAHDHFGFVSERLGSVLSFESYTRQPFWIGDDDDGIVSVSNLYPGSTTATIVVSASNPAGTFPDYCRLWVRRSGVTAPWSNTSDALATQTAMVGPAGALFTFGPFTHSLATGAPSPFVRVRLSYDTTGVSSFLGTGAYGEVEDYVLTGSGGPTTGTTGGGSDAGDAPLLPLPYPPVNSRNVNGERLGTAVTGDAMAPVGFPGSTGTDAWNDDTGDDGIVRIDGLAAGGNATITVRGMNPTGSFSEVFSLWMDFDGDGNWDEAGEHVHSGVTGVGPAGATVALGISVPAMSVSPVPTRIKLSNWSSGFNQAHWAAGASFTFGEVEDYLVPLQAGTGCNTTPGPAATAWADDPPRLGGTFTYRLAGFSPGALLFTAISPFYGSGVDLAALGLGTPPGACSLYVLPLVLFNPGSADAAGNATVGIPVPADMSFTGVTVGIQTLQVPAIGVVFATPNLPVTVLP